MIGRIDRRLIDQSRRRSLGARLFSASEPLNKVKGLSSTPMIFLAFVDEVQVTTLCAGVCDAPPMEAVLVNGAGEPARRCSELWSQLTVESTHGAGTLHSSVFRVEYA